MLAVRCATGQNEAIAPVHFTLDEARALLGLRAVSFAQHVERCAVWRVDKTLCYHGTLRGLHARIGIRVDSNHAAACVGTSVHAALVFVIRGRGAADIRMVTHCCGTPVGRRMVATVTVIAFFGALPRAQASQIVVVYANIGRVCTKENCELIVLKLNAKK